MSKLLIILFSLTFFFSVNGTCNFRYSSKNHPCNTKATLLQCNEFMHIQIKSENWNYYPISLQDIQGSIELDFKTDSPLLYGYLLFQNSDGNFLPNRTNYDNSFPLDEKNKVISSKIPSDMKGGWLAIGLYNPSSYNIDAEIRYFMNGGNCKCPMSTMAMILIISLWISGSLVLFAGIYSLRKLVQIQQENSSAILNVRRNTPETELVTETRFEVWSQETNYPIENKGKQDELLTLKEIEEYFPKQAFQTLKNPFQQTTCSICWDEYDLETECCQLFCHHIFHETCIRKWMEKHNSCPGCRLSITKDTLKEFLGRKENELLIKL